MLWMLAACSSATQVPVTRPTHGAATSTSKQTQSAAGATPAEPAGAPLDGRLRVQQAGRCGGAAIPDDYEGPELKPAAKVRLDVVPGGRYREGPPILEITTAMDGRFMAPLPAGRYCVVRAGRGAKPTTAGKYENLACLVERWERCDAVVDVPVKHRIAIDIVEQCRWTICSDGPEPP